MHPISRDPQSLLQIKCYFFMLQKNRGGWTQYDNKKPSKEIIFTLKTHCGVVSKMLSVQSWIFVPAPQIPIAYGVAVCCGYAKKEKKREYLCYTLQQCLQINSLGFLNSLWLWLFFTKGEASEIKVWFKIFPVAAILGFKATLQEQNSLVFFLVSGWNAQ